MSRLGCFGCHDIPGFENAKPIGTALNDWGKKDGERLAFEDSKAFIEQTLNVVHARDNPADPSQPAEDWTVKDGKQPYEKYFLELLEHHQRDGFLNLKLMEPRSFDYNRIRTWDDRLRMPQFQFARLRAPKIEPKKSDETDKEFEDRQKEAAEEFARHKSFAEAKAREAVMTFVLGLVAEPISAKYVNNPGPDKLAVVKGRQVLEKFNCAGCHQVQPGVYEFKPTSGTIAQLEASYKSAASQFAADHPFASHNAWAGTPTPWPDRLTAFATSPRELKKEEDDQLPEDLLAVRLSDALRFTGSDGVERDLPAGSFARIPTGDLVSQSEPFGGAFTELLSKEFVTKRYQTTIKTADDARSVLPPPLLREGERIQPKWLYPFLLNPTVIRPDDYMLLRMPKFNMSPDDARALVNYFSAVNKLNNPGIGLTYPYLAIEQRDDRYWRDRTAEYARRLGKDKVEAKAKALDPTWEAEVARQLAEAKHALESAQKALKEAKPDTKEDLTKAVAAASQRVKELQTKLDKKDFADLRKHFETQEIYATDAFQLLTNRDLCLKCHNVGSYQSAGAKGPNLDLTAERLRPEWTLAWIGNPIRMFPYQPVMPVNFPRNESQYNESFEGSSLDKVRAVRDVLLDLPRLIDLPGNRPKSAPAVAMGGK